MKNITFGAEKYKIRGLSEVPVNIQDYTDISHLEEQLRKLIMLHNDYFLKEKVGFSDKSNISFAWEEDKLTLGRINGFAKTATDLVVIGYSFPLFNREIDIAILEHMENDSLNSIYIQDLYPKKIKTSIASILPDFDEDRIDITPSENLDEFFIPHYFIRERMEKKK